MGILPEWVVYNLRRYHNSLLDTKLVKKEGIAAIVKELENRKFKGVTIHVSNSNYIVEVKQVDREF